MTRRSCCRSGSTLGSWHLNPGDVLLAASLEASLRAAREALVDLRRGPRNQSSPLA
jgi:hypothetical protein